jgi:hypothetical protein
MPTVALSNKGRVPAAICSFVVKLVAVDLDGKPSVDK